MLSVCDIDIIIFFFGEYIDIIIEFVGCLLNSLTHSGMTTIKSKCISEVQIISLCLNQIFYDYILVCLYGRYPYIFN